MSRGLRILVADDERDTREFLREALERLGHEVVSECSTGIALLEQCRERQPSFIITDIKMPDMDGLEACKIAYEERPVPVLVLTAHIDDVFVSRAEESHVLGYLVKPIRESALAPAIQIALRRFTEFQMLKEEATTLRQALEDRKLIERARGLIMKQSGLDEESAFRKLQKLSNQNNLKLAQMARTLLDAAGML